MLSIIQTASVVFTLVQLQLSSAAPLKPRNTIIQHFQDASSSAQAWLDLHIPSTDDIKRIIGLKIVPTPIDVFNVPGYANWTSNGWNMRIHGTASKPLPMTDARLDFIGQRLVPGLAPSNWTADIRRNIRNMTSTILAFPQGHVPLSFAVDYKGRPIADFALPKGTDGRGEFDTWFPVESPLLESGEGRGYIQQLDIHANVSAIGNSTNYLVPEEGLTVVSDIDDVLRHTRFWIPFEGMINTFGLNFIPWPGMPEVMQAMYDADPTTHFHYITTTPQTSARRYLEFTLNYYPKGSFDFRPLNLTNIQQTLHVRKYNLIRVMETFPKRKFVLLGDTSNNDAVAGYAEVAALFPDQVQCVLIRNVTATDPYMIYPSNTAAYKDLSPTQYQYFRTPEDLVGIDFANGGCRNYTFPQNMTHFGLQKPTLEEVSQGLRLGRSWGDAWRSLLNDFATAL